MLRIAVRLVSWDLAVTCLDIGLGGAVVEVRFLQHDACTFLAADAQHRYPPIIEMPSMDHLHRWHGIRYGHSAYWADGIQSHMVHDVLLRERFQKPLMKDPAQPVPIALIRKGIGTACA